MKHAQVAASSDNLYNKSDFLLACQKATAIHISCHGSPNTLGTMDMPDANVNGSDVTAAVQNRGVLPPINIVFVAACSTLHNGARSLPTAFGIDSNSTDRAYVGLDNTGFGPVEVVEVFWNALWGKGVDENGNVKMTGPTTVAEATKAAQIAYNDHNTDGNNVSYPANLVIFGDSSATLYCMYGDLTTNWWELAY